MYCVILYTHFCVCIWKKEKIVMKALSARQLIRALETPMLTVNYAKVYLTHKVHWIHWMPGLENLKWWVIVPGELFLPIQLAPRSGHVI